MATEVVRDLGIFAGGSTLLYLLFRALFKHLLNKDIEKFKADLRAIAFEREIRFSRLHDVRMKAIEEIYSLLVRTQYAFIDLTKPLKSAGESSEEEKIKEVYESAGSLKRYFDKKRIYLTDDICAKFDELNLLLLEIKNDYELFLSEVSQTEPKEKFTIAEDVWKKVSKDVNDIKKQMETEFRRLLGVEFVSQLKENAQS